MMEYALETVNSLLDLRNLTITSLAQGRWMMTRGSRAGDGGAEADRR